MGPFDVKGVYLVLLAFKMKTTQAEFEPENVLAVEDQWQEKDESALMSCLTPYLSRKSPFSVAETM